MMNEELDYQYEASSMRRMRKRLRRHGVYVPKVYPDYTKGRLLVSEFIHAVLMADYIRLAEADPVLVRSWEAANNVDPTRVAKRLIHSMWRQLFEENLYHGDLHPGNIVLLRDSRVALDRFRRHQLHGARIPREIQDVRRGAIELRLRQGRGPDVPPFVSAPADRHGSRQGETDPAAARLVRPHACQSAPVSRSLDRQRRGDHPERDRRIQADDGLGVAADSTRDRHARRVAGLSLSRAELPEDHAAVPSGVRTRAGCAGCSAPAWERAR